MAEFRWIKTSLFLMLALQFTATLEQYTSSTVRVGGEVTLPCRDVTEDQDECDDITWSIISRNLEGDLFLYGQMTKNTKADRLSVTEKCSLVIKKVTAEDAGQYLCQHKPIPNQVYLFVVTMTKQEDDRKVTLNCSVSTYGECEHTVKWLYEGKDYKDMMTSPSGCSVNVTTSLSESKHHELFQCEVTDIFGGKPQQFSYQDSDEETGEDEKTSTSKPTTTPRTKPTLTKTPATTPPATTTANKSTSTVTNNTISTDSNIRAQGQGWWWLIILPVVLAALFVVALIRWKRTKGNRAQLGSNTADPEDGVSYASVSFTKTNSKAQVKGNDGDGDNEGDAVTYSTVKASSSA